ncbi:MAG: CoA-transferase [Dehalococcoidia bacterium]
MEKYMNVDKRMTMEDAISKYVNDGESFVYANCLTGMPLALTHELIRSGKKNLMLFDQASIEEIDMLIEARVIDRLVTTFNFRVGGKRTTSPLERALKERRLKIEELSNLTMLSMMKAGAMGYSFIPVLSGIKMADFVKRSNYLGNQRFGEVKDPFTGKKQLVVKGYNPDFAFMHVQRADTAGNGQMWGAMFNSKWAALAANKIILTCEKIVDAEVIKSSPHLTIAPSFKVCAVIECPWGAHPSELAGFYDNDFPFRALYFATLGSSASIKTWMDEWIYGIKDRGEYLAHYVEKLGTESLDVLRAKPRLSVPADYGNANSYEWDESGYNRSLDMNMSQFVEFLDKKGVLLQS